MRETVTETVILAAGYGSRLAGHSTGVPKPLARIGGIPLIAHALEHAIASGCRRAVVVIGHEGEQVRAAVGRVGHPIEVEFVENPKASEPNGVSLLAAEPRTGRTFFLQMVDHLFAAAVLPRLVADLFAPDEAGRLLVDPAPRGIDLRDATKVTVAGGKITGIGKQLQPWDAIDTGCFVLTHAIFDALRRVPHSEPRTVSSGMRQLATRGMLGAVEIGPVEWIDVDTPADREAAEGLLARQAFSGVPRWREEALAKEPS